MTRTILVTGATGTVGQHVVDKLGGRDATVRIASRNPDEARGELDAGAETVAFDFERPETWGEALTKVDGFFLVRPPVVDADEIGRFVEAAARVGVEQVAYLSTLGAEKNPLVPHHRIEQRIAACDVEYPFLRASFLSRISPRSIDGRSSNAMRSSCRPGMEKRVSWTPGAWVPWPRPS